MPDAQPFLVAAVQATPVFLDRKATTDKACDLIGDAGKKGVRLALFPEAFIPSYPFWIWYVPAGRSPVLRALYAELVANAVSIPDETTDRLCAAARKARVNVAIGVNERNTEASGASLYNTILLIDEQGEIRGRHRKLVPTVGERMIHAQGDGSTLAVHDLGFARVSGLVCWENYMPLARYALYAWGTQIHLAPTWDSGEPWISTLRHIAKEGRVFVVGCCSAVHRDDVPDRYPFKQDFLPQGAEWINKGDSAIVNPDGKFLVEPVSGREEMLIAEVDPVQMTGPRYQLDVAGHYARPDVFELRVHRRPRPVVQVEEPLTGSPELVDSED